MIDKYAELRNHIWGKRRIIRDLLDERDALVAGRCMSQWISTSEKMPATGKKVLATFINQCDKRRTICAHYIPRWTQESCCAESHDEYSEELDNYFMCEGWYEDIENWGEYSSVHVCEGDVTHWMPLPDAPEVTPPAAEVNKQLLEALRPLRFDVWADHYEEDRLWYEPCEEGSFLYYDQVVAILKTESQEKPQ